MTDGLVCKTNVAAHHEHNDCTRGIFRRVCVGCGVCETFASDKNEISTGHFGGGHVRENRAKIADLRKKKLLIRTTLMITEWLGLQCEMRDVISIQHEYPIRFHSFDISANQSGCSQYVTVLL